MSDDIGSKVVETFIEGYEKVRKAIKENGISNMEVMITYRVSNDIFILLLQFI